MTVHKHLQTLSHHFIDRTIFQPSPEKHWYNGKKAFLPLGAGFLSLESQFSYCGLHYFWQSI